MHRKLNITREELEDLYVNQLLSQSKIAAICGVSRTAVEHSIKKMSITRTQEQWRKSLKVNPSGRKKVYQFDLSDLRSLYCEDGLTVDQIAVIKKATNSSVRKQLKKLGLVAPRTPSGKIMVPESRKKYKTKPHSESELRRWLIDEHLPVREVAERLGVSVGTVHIWKRKYDIYLPVIEARKYATAKRWDDYRKDVIVTSGYRNVHDPAHPRSDYYGRIPEHMVLVEGWMDRSIQPDEIVHHIDMVKLNNSKGNLSVLHKNDHARIHHYYQLVGLYLSGVSSVRPKEFKFRQLSFWGGHWVWWVDLLGPIENKAVVA